MDVTAIRLANLRLLIEEVGGTSVLAEKAGTAASYLSLLKSGSGKIMGNDLARRLEEATGKETGWMDTRHDQTIPDEVVELATKLLTLHPRMLSAIRTIISPEVEQTSDHGRLYGTLGVILDNRLIQARSGGGILDVEAVNTKRPQARKGRSQQSDT